MLTYILLNLVGLLKEMDDKQCDLHTFHLKYNIVKKIFSKFFCENLHIFKQILSKKH